MVNWQQKNGGNYEKKEVAKSFISCDSDGIDIYVYRMGADGQSVRRIRCHNR